MDSIDAIYDGNTFQPLEPIPFKGHYEVKILFLSLRWVSL